MKKFHDEFLRKMLVTICNLKKPKHSNLSVLLSGSIFTIHKQNVQKKKEKKEDVIFKEKKKQNFTLRAC